MADAQPLDEQEFAAATKMAGRGIGIGPVTSARLLATVALYKDGCAEQAAQNTRLVAELGELRTQLRVCREELGLVLLAKPAEGEA